LKYNTCLVLSNVPKRQILPGVKMRGGSGLCGDRVELLRAGVGQYRGGARVCLQCGIALGGPG